MARYTGPKTKISRIFGEPITGNGKWLTKNSNPPGIHGANRKRKTLGEYALQLREKLREVYGCEVYSLNPFVNLGLEGHKYAHC